MYNTQAHSSSSEALDDVVSLGLGPVRVDHFNIDTIVDELTKQLLSPLLALDKDQDWRRETLYTNDAHINTSVR